MKNKKTKRKINIGRLFSIILSVGIVLAIAISAWGFSYIAVQIKAAPTLDVSDFNSTDSSKIYASDGSLVSDVGYQLRENVSYSDFPQTLVDAFVSIEDSRFFDHNGFDIPRFTKAVFENILTSIKDRHLVFAQGGSTFTMQLVKNTYFVTEESNAADSGWAGINRKIQEIYLALELENVVAKERILELYLNMINFGVPGNKRGIQTAAQYYFGKEVNQLSLVESALLAGIINAPTTYSPINDLKSSIERTHTVLNLMVTHGYITSEEASLAKKIDIENLIVGNLNNSDELPYQAYVDAVIDEVIALTGLNPVDVPMKIYTSMDVNLQNAIEDVQNNKSKVKWPDDLMQTAIVTLNNKTGEIVGLGGGRYYNGQRLFNRATSMYRQPGSSVKPILPYVLAFEYLGWATDHVIEDHPYSFSEINDKMIVGNWDHRYHGDIFITNAIGNSWNVPAILTMKDVVNTMGYKAITDYINSIGFSDIHLTGDKVFDLGYAIGGSTFTVTPVSLAGAHAAIVNAGNYIVPHAVTRIEFLDGTAPLEPSYSSTKVVSSEAAYLSTMMMEQNVTGPWSNGMQMLERDYQVYAKTGTSDWGTEGKIYGIPENAAKDKWMLGSTTEYTIAIWTGYDTAKKGQQSYISAANVSKKIPNNIVSLLLDELYQSPTDYPANLPKPSGIVPITHVLGVYPYVSPLPGMDPTLVSTGLIKKSFATLGTLSVPVVFTPDTFVAEVSVNDMYKHFTFTFSPYADPEALLVAPNTKKMTLTVGKTTINAIGTRLFDISWVYGPVEYKVDIKVDGTYLTTLTSSSNILETDLLLSATSTVEVCGFNAYRDLSYGSGLKCQTLDLGTLNVSVPSSFTNHSYTTLENWLSGNGITDQTVIYSLTSGSPIADLGKVTSISPSIEGNTYTLAELESKVITVTVNDLKLNLYDLFVNKVYASPSWESYLANATIYINSTVQPIANLYGKTVTQIRIGYTSVKNTDSQLLHDLSNSIIRFTTSD